MRSRAAWAALALGGTAITVLGVLASLDSSGREADPLPPSRVPRRDVAHALRDAGLVDHGLIDAAAVRALVDGAPPPPPPDRQPAYDRHAFGPSWSDTDRNGCDQHEDVLARDLVAVSVVPGTQGCVIHSGNLADPYTGQGIDYVRGAGTSAAVEVDRIVPLPWAWSHGAAAWRADQREALASDLENLQAVDGPTMRDKREQGPAEWLPPGDDYRCVYAARFAYLVSQYGLALGEGDREALRAASRTCPALEIVDQGVEIMR
ncbi:HNH endonuclease [Clavibacter sp. VKM Ac-2873]|uniref:HNH endonuclease family protein n=1 Tax=Clavibacter sp. VKM Ac-2873 TaxID=2783813 RepID=UPI00188BBC8B|nr:HNH endonuclease family protein [Clavibacter sp. VKM Ac-2873]MBF4619463.1 HNH endonuclease [Clavibacter sp. VKM Ac-2873]